YRSQNADRQLFDRHQSKAGRLRRRWLGRRLRSGSRQRRHPQRARPDRAGSEWIGALAAVRAGGLILAGRLDARTGGHAARPASMTPWKPTRAQLAAAYGKGVRDVIAPDLRLLFCGINPGLYTAAIGHHFGRPGNRFWPALHRGGFTDRQLSPFEERELLTRGYGI